MPFVFNGATMPQPEESPELDAILVDIIFPGIRWFFSKKKRKQQIQHKHIPILPNGIIDLHPADATYQYNPAGKIFEFGSKKCNPLDYLATACIENNVSLPCLGAWLDYHLANINVITTIQAGSSMTYFMSVGRAARASFDSNKPVYYFDKTPAYFLFCMVGKSGELV